MLKSGILASGSLVFASFVATITEGLNNSNIDLTFLLSKMDVGGVVVTGILIIKYLLKQHAETITRYELLLKEQTTKIDALNKEIIDTLKESK